MNSGADYRDQAPDDAPDPGSEHRSWAVALDEHGARIDRVLAQHASEFSRTHLQRLIEEGHVRLDGMPCVLPSRRVKAAQRIDLELVPTAEALAFRPQAMALPIVYEDAHVIVVDKPAGLVVHPGAGNWSGTLLNGLLAYHPEAGRLPRAGIVHRLDKGTSGLMVVGKTLAAVTELVRAIAAREVRREYLALIHGVPRWQHQVFEGPIGRDPRSRLRMAVISGGRPARTDVWRVGTTDQMAAVVCQLHTGRTHQIRVHLAHAGHPLVGDPMYGGAMALGLGRPALHARRLGFTHPHDGVWVSFEATLPADFDAAWKAVVGHGAD